MIISTLRYALTTVLMYELNELFGFFFVCLFQDVNIDDDLLSD